MSHAMHRVDRAGRFHGVVNGVHSPIAPHTNAPRHISSAHQPPERFAGLVRSVQDAAEAATVVPSLLHTGDVVLVKGSRGVGLELVCRALRNGSDGA